MEFKFNAQLELSCNREGYSVIKLEHILNEEYENSQAILDILNKLRFMLKKV